MNSILKELIDRQAEDNYKRLVEEGFDVVLPPEPIYPVTYEYAVRAQNYAIQRLQITKFVQDVLKKHGMRRKVHVIVLDTGAKSRNRFIQRNFQDIGKDHTPENQPIDEHGHLSFCASQVMGENNGPLGPLAVAGIPTDMWSWSGEKLLRRAGSGTFTEIAKGLQHALGIADQKRAQGHAVFFSCSWGSQNGNSAEIRDIFKLIRDRGHFTFAAGGNSGSAGVGFPASIGPDATGEILFAIGAVDASDRRAGFSSVGDQLDFTSYGVQNLGVGPGEYQSATGSGTSYSTPLAVACAALLTGVFPEIENMADLEYVLTSGATELGERKHFGHGLIRMDGYSDEDLPGDDPNDPDPDPDPVPDPDPDPSPGDEIPERELTATHPGTFRVKWAVMAKGQSLAAGIVAQTGSAVLVDLSEGDVAAKYNWRDMYIHAPEADLFLAGDAEKLMAAWQRYVEGHWPDGQRGVLMAHPADFVEGGKAALLFLRMFAKREGWTDEQLGQLRAEVSLHPDTVTVRIYFDKR